MGFELLSEVNEEVEREVQRIAVAFEMEQSPVLVSRTEATERWEVSGGGLKLEVDLGHSGLFKDQYKGVWQIELTDGYRKYINLERDPDVSPLWFLLKSDWLEYNADSLIPALMARALYRLGFEDGGVLRQLNSPLSNHEKMELRLSMPREFWPRQWVEEAGETRLQASGE